MCLTNELPRDAGRRPAKTAASYLPLAASKLDSSGEHGFYHDRKIASDAFEGRVTC
jgi:hypothetical protein